MGATTLESTIRARIRSDLGAMAASPYWSTLSGGFAEVEILVEGSKSLLKM